MAWRAAIAAAALVALAFGFWAFPVPFRGTAVAPIQAIAVAASAVFVASSMRGND